MALLTYRKYYYTRFCKTLSTQYKSSTYEFQLIDFSSIFLYLWPIEFSVYWYTLIYSLMLQHITGEQSYNALVSHVTLIGDSERKPASFRTKKMSRWYQILSIQSSYIEMHLLKSAFIIRSRIGIRVSLRNMSIYLCTFFKILSSHSIIQYCSFRHTLLHINWLRPETPDKVSER